MISQELMLGDWVMLNPDLKEYYPFAGKSCMVIGLHDDDGAIKIEYDNGKYFWTDAEDDVIPIPLTPEILEKNNFLKVIWQGRRCTAITTYAIGEGFNLEEDNDGFNLVDNYSDSGDYGYESNYICDIKYVHELQHALKLCGIEKTIII